MAARGSIDVSMLTKLPLIGGRGPQGATGAAGANGTNGTNGTDGSVRRPFRSGQLYTTPGTAQLTGTAAVSLGVGNARIHLFKVDITTTFDLFQVGNIGTSGTLLARGLIYSVTAATLTPVDPVVLDTGTISLAGAAATAVISQSLTPGWYYIGLNLEGSGAAILFRVPAWASYFDTPLGVTSFATGAPNGRLQQTGTAAGAPAAAGYALTATTPEQGGSAWLRAA